jgi:hypothetical protein
VATDGDSITRDQPPLLLCSAEHEEEEERLGVNSDFSMGLSVEVVTWVNSVVGTPLRDLIKVPSGAKMNNL